MSHSRSCYFYFYLSIHVVSRFAASYSRKHNLFYHMIFEFEYMKYYISVILYDVCHVLICLSNLVLCHAMYRLTNRGERERERANTYFMFCSGS